MSSIYKRKRNGENDGYVMYSIYAYDPLKNKKRYFNITLGKIGPTLTWDDCLKQKKELDRVFEIKKGGKQEIQLNKAIKTYLKHKMIHFNIKPPKNSSIQLQNYHLDKFKDIIVNRYGSGIMVKHIDDNMLKWYYEIRQQELKTSSFLVHKRIINSFLSWTKD
ncbi:hypothetical protein N8720_00450 [Candidatus Marinimicrobia bacterium]|nr:hypothetical protein [Candidatus Neomarinimicrobiota bacterium]